jgi:predicted DCC family thiol-disulfide oxidoreductase YuxK
MRQLTVIYDANCAFCERCKRWAEIQPQYVRLRFLPRQDEATYVRFPQIMADACDDELVAIGDDGAVYRDAKAWLMCLYALKRYRPLALRLSRPRLQGFARRAFHLVSQNRHHIPAWCWPRGDDRLAASLRQVAEPMRCTNQGTTTQALRSVKHSRDFE